MDLSIKDFFRKTISNLFLDEGFYNGLVKEYRKNQLLLEDLLKKEINLQNIDPDFYQSIAQTIIRLKWYSFGFLNDKEIIELFKFHLKMILVDKTFSIDESLRLHFLTLLLPERDELKKQTREAMLLNNEELTSGVIDIKDSKNTPTIANWLKLYNYKLGIEILNRLKLAEFYVQDKNYNQLIGEEKELVKKLFDLYEKLKLSSFMPEGLEEEEYRIIGDKLVIMSGTGIKEVIRSISNKDELVDNLSNNTNTEYQITDQSNAQSILNTDTKINEKEEGGSDALPTDMGINQILAQTTPQPFLDDLISQLNLSFSDEIFKTRFQNIITSYLRGIRKDIDVRETLQRPQKVGGMEYDQGKVDAILKFLREAKEKLEPAIKKDISVKPALAEGLVSPQEIITPRSPELTPEKSLPEPEEVPLISSANPEEVQKDQFSAGPLSPPVVDVKIDESTLNQSLPPESPAPSAINDLSMPEIQSSDNIPNSKTEENQFSDLLSNFETSMNQANMSPESTLEKAVESGSAQDIPSSADSTDSGNIQKVFHSTASPIKPVVEDIKVTPKIYGPVDELRTISLADWRRWGSATEAAKRMLDKINLLGEESLVKRSEGVSAWKSSEVNKLYLDIGTESIDNGLSVEQVIQKRKTENRPTLTIEEFNAVSEVNQKLRF